jgi:hypothetical protein
METNVSEIYRKLNGNSIQFNSVLFICALRLRDLLTKALFFPMLVAVNTLDQNRMGWYSGRLRKYHTRR